MLINVSKKNLLLTCSLDKMLLYIWKFDSKKNHFTHAWQLIYSNYNYKCTCIWKLQTFSCGIPSKRWWQIGNYQHYFQHNMFNDVHFRNGIRIWFRLYNRHRIRHKVRTRFFRYGTIFLKYSILKIKLSSYIFFIQFKHMELGRKQRKRPAKGEHSTYCCFI